MSTYLNNNFKIESSYFVLDLDVFLSKCKEFTDCCDFFFFVIF